MTVEVDPSKRTNYRFGNGQKQTTIPKVQLPVKLGDDAGSAAFDVLDANSPAPLGVELMRASKAAIDCDEGLVIFEAISDEKHKKTRLESGHQALRAEGQRSGQKSGQRPPSRGRRTWARDPRGKASTTESALPIMQAATDQMATLHHRPPQRHRHLKRVHQHQLARHRVHHLARQGARYHRWHQLARHRARHT